MSVTVGQDDRAHLTAVRATRYALGPPEAPLLVLNDADDDGCLWGCDVPDGWDAPDVDTPSTRRPTGHGSFLGVSTYGPRTLSFDGLTTAPTPAALDSARRRLLRAVLGQLGGFVRYTHLDEDPAPMGLWVRPTGKPRWRAVDDRAAQWAFVVIAEDPIKTGPAAHYGPISLMTTALRGGRSYPRSYPQGYTGSVVGTTAVRVFNDGTEDAHAVYRIHGPLAQPVIRLSNGQALHARVDLGPYDELVISTADGTLLLNGADRADAWGPGSTFPLIPAGSYVDVRLDSFTGSAYPDAYLTIDTAPAWS